MNSGGHIPLLAKEGWPRHQENSPVPKRRGRGGRSRVTLRSAFLKHLLVSDHPVCGASMASRLLVDAAATPPHRRGIRLLEHTGEIVHTFTNCHYIHNIKSFEPSGRFYRRFSREGAQDRSKCPSPRLYTYRRASEQQQRRQSWLPFPRLFRPWFWQLFQFARPNRSLLWKYRDASAAVDGKAESIPMFSWRPGYLQFWPLPEDLPSASPDRAATSRFQPTFRQRPPHAR